MRRLSPYLTRILLGTAITANGVTVLMIVTGAAAGAALLIPGLVGAVLAALLAQLQMLWDCCDGEVARWRQTFSPTGFFLDKLGHYTVAECAIPLALGVRADGGFDSLGGWTTLGALLAVLVLVNKSLNDAVHVARAVNGLPAARGQGRGGRPAGVDRPPAARRWRGSCRSTGPSTRSSSPCSPWWPRSSTRRSGGLDGTRLLLAVLVPAAAADRRRAPRGDPHLEQAAMTRPTVGAVVLSMGTRPEEFPRALESLLAQQGVDLDVVVVGNGWEPVGLPDGCPHRPPAGERRHPGGPQRRGGGVPRRVRCSSSTTTPTCPPTTCWRGWSSVLRADERVGAVQPRPVDPTGQPSPRAVGAAAAVGRPAAPRRGRLALGGHLRRTPASCSSRPAAGPGTSSTATRASSCPGGSGTRGSSPGTRRTSCATIRRPRPPGTTTYYRLNARNRVWVARRNLPWPLAVIYVAVWTALTVVRFRSVRLLRLWFAGFREGLGPGARRATADALADRVAAHPGGQTADRVSNTGDLDSVVAAGRTSYANENERESSAPTVRLRPARSA